MFLKNLSISKKVCVGVGLPILLSVVVAVFVFIGLKKVEYTDKWVLNTTKVLSQADSIVASAVDMETGMSGFLLAGKEEFLEPYKSGGGAKSTNFCAICKIRSVITRF